MANADKSQKTEKPTPKRKKEAHEKGQIARTPELATWLGMLVLSQTIKSTVEHGAKTFTGMLQGMALVIAKPDQGSASRYAAKSALQGAELIAPLMLVLMGVTIVVWLGQVGLKPSLKRLKPDFSRLNAAKGLKRLVSPQSYWEVAKSILKVAVLTAVVWPAIAHASNVFASGTANSLNEVASVTALTALSVLRNVSVAALMIAVADYIVQKRRVNKEIAMTKQEVKEEYKRNEGNPEMRRAIRQRQAAIGRNRMIGLVSQADVVVVNPTHYSVALKYEATKGAPQVVAKGAGVMAARIRREAEAHGVPIVHEPVLTRALYRVCEIGTLIPAELYEGVAHLLAFVFSLRANGRAEGYHEMPVVAPAF